MGLRSLAFAWHAFAASGRSRHSDEDDHSRRRPVLFVVADDLRPQLGSFGFDDAVLGALGPLVRHVSIACLFRSRRHTLIGLPRVVLPSPARTARHQAAIQAARHSSPAYGHRPAALINPYLSWNLGISGREQSLLL